MDSWHFESINSIWILQRVSFIDDQHPFCPSLALNEKSFDSSIVSTLWIPCKGAGLDGRLSMRDKSSSRLGQTRCDQLWECDVIQLEWKLFCTLVSVLKIGSSYFRMQFEFLYTLIQLKARNFHRKSLKLLGFRNNRQLTRGWRGFQLDLKSLREEILNC